MMNCQMCGTHLPAEAWACPTCGTRTPASYALSGTSANDPTIPAGLGAPPAVMSVSSLPPTQYGANPYESALQSPYPVNLYEAPPPSRRKGNRIGIIIGVVLLILLLSSGGVFAWLHGTAPTFPANGAFTIIDSTTTGVTQNGQDTITNYIEHGEFTGDLTGSYTLQGTNTVHPNKTGTGSGVITCTCTVKGKSGMLRQSISYTMAADGSFQGQTFDFQGTGDLASLQGQGTFQGQGNNGTYADQLRFDG